MIPKWYRLATAALGEQEIRGAAHNPRIVAYQQATSLRANDDKTPWCGAFVAWCLREAGLPYNVACAAASRSWLRWGRKLDKPTIGCVVVFWRGSRDGWQGHVGFYAGRAKNGDILVLGGNQGDAVSMRPYPVDRLLGYRWPETVPLPPDVEPLSRSGVVRGTGVAVASGGLVLAENLPQLVTELERGSACAGGDGVRRCDWHADRGRRRLCSLAPRAGRARIRGGQRVTGWFLRSRACAAWGSGLRPPAPSSRPLPRCAGQANDPANSRNSSHRNGRCPMQGSGCSMHRAIVLAGVTILLGGCATATPERTGVACVPVPEYGREVLERAADEVEALPDGSAVVGMLEDFAVMRAQGRACR